MYELSWQKGLEEALSKKLGEEISTKNISGISGGDINDAYRVETSIGVFFVKTNDDKRYPAMFEKEARGLALMEASKTVAVPEVILTGADEQTAFLVLKLINPTSRKPDFWNHFGSKLAQMHRHTNPNFGLDHDNYIGSLHQSNHTHTHWADFFREERLEPQIKLARDRGLVNKDLTRNFDAFYKRIEGIFPDEPPALVHGDLWGGNFMVGGDGRAVVIDPAVYYGHREMDMGMSQLFGGFDALFYEAYQREYPLENGWQKRLEYCNLYPLMVHVNLFGGSYLSGVKSTINRFH